MKNMKKFITICGFLVLGSIACGDVDIVKAEAINNQTTDTSGYTITIPSEVGIDKDSGKGSFAVTGKMDAQTELDVSVSSQNGYKLKNKNQEISYSLDKGSFHIDNIKSADMKSFDENFNISLANTNTNYSGNYEDRLTFNIGSNKYTYELDMNSILDGVQENERHNYGSADVYINGILKAENVSDFREILNYGDTYEFKNIKATDGHHFVGINSCANTSIKGRIGVDTNHLWTRHDNPYNLIAPIFFEFNTNKLTINYHADGAQTWHHFDNITYDVSGKDIAYTSVHLYGNSYDAKFGLGDVSRLTKDGYTAKPNTWIVGKNGNKEIRDDKGLSKVEDIADYCGVLDEFKKNNTTIDLYPIWIPNTYTLTVNPNGGLINGDGSSKILDTKLCFDTGNCWDINYLKPTRKGFEFLGWYDAPENGNIVYDSNGKCINNGNYWKDSSYVNPNNLTVYAQWKKQYTLTFDANGGTVSETSRTITEGSQVGSLPTPTKEGYQFYGWYTKPQSGVYYAFNGGNDITEDTTIVASWEINRDNLAVENKNALSDGTYKLFQVMDNLSSYCFSPRFDSDDSGNPVLLKKDNGSEYSLWQVEHDDIGYVMLKNKKTGKYLDLNSASAQSNQGIQLYEKNGTYAQKWIVRKYGEGYRIASACNPNFMIDLSGCELKADGYGYLSLWYDNGTLAQRWNFKKVQ